MSIVDTRMRYTSHELQVAWHVSFCLAHALARELRRLGSDSPLDSLCASPRPGRLLQGRKGAKTEQTEEREQASCAVSECV